MTSYLIHWQGKKSNMSIETSTKPLRIQGRSLKGTFKQHKKCKKILIKMDKKKKSPVSLFWWFSVFSWCLGNLRYESKYLNFFSLFFVFFFFCWYLGWKMWRCRDWCWTWCCKQCYRSTGSIRLHLYTCRWKSLTWSAYFLESAEWWAYCWEGVDPRKCLKQS